MLFCNNFLTVGVYVVSLKSFTIINLEKLRCSFPACPQYLTFTSIYADQPAMYTKKKRNRTVLDEYFTERCTASNWNNFEEILKTGDTGLLK